MSLIIADARLGVWKATDEGGPLTGVDCALEGPRLTCAGSACVCVGGNRECLCLTCHGLREISRMPAAPGLAALCLMMNSAAISFGVIQIPIELFALFAMIPICLYSGRKATASRAVQLGFYLFYPVHLAVLAVIMKLCFGG